LTLCTLPVEAFKRYSRFSQLAIQTELREADVMVRRQDDLREENGAAREKVWFVTIVTNVPGKQVGHSNKAALIQEGQENEAAARFRALDLFAALEITVSREKGAGAADAITQNILVFFPYGRLFPEGWHVSRIDRPLLHQTFHLFSAATGHLFLLSVFEKHAVGSAYVVLKPMLRHETCALSSITTMV